jgi:ATP-binding cassette subfamily B protein
LARISRSLAETREPEGGVALGAGPGQIVIRGLRFAYDGRDAAIDGLDLHVRARETVVIVGPNGAGKSTLASLLLRLYPIESGSIQIDGTDIGDASLASLRGQIGYVPQHTYLSHASILDNIAFGRSGEGRQAIEAAARAAGVHDFIESLPEGYETVIGERGVRLSGGQQQKIALARALLKDPPILILDEATSMFDPAAEREFFEACAQSLRRRTVIVITHRASDLVHADRTVHMNAGKVVFIETSRTRCSSSASSR